MTWHQWHHTASRSSNTNFCSRLASVKTSSDQPSHLRFVPAGVADVWRAVEPAFPAKLDVAIRSVAIKAICFTSGPQLSTTWPGELWICACPLVPRGRAADGGLLELDRRPKRRRPNAILCKLLLKLY